MKPSRLQYILAHSVALSGVGGAVCLLFFLGVQSLLSPVLLLDPSFDGWLLLAIIVVSPLGWILGVLFIAPLVFILASKLNGAPFQIGDTVHVLAGEHRDRVVRIYEVWHSRRSVRVGLSEQEQKDVTDVFDYNQVCRELSAI